MHPLLRVTLDLFAEPARDAAPRPAPSKASPKPTAVPRPPAPDPAAQVAFQHPQASRVLQLPHAVIAYAFVRSQRRSIGFSVGPEGLSVRAPRWVTLKDVDAALHSKADWIVRKLHESREQQVKAADQVIEWRDGAEFAYLGQNVRLQLDPAHGFGAAGAELQTAPAAMQATPGQTLPAPVKYLRLSLPVNASASQIQDAVQAWLMRQARQVFTERLDHFAPLLAVKWQRLSLSNANTRWGSARVDGAIRLNWRLIHRPLSVIDYVVAHELSHLRVMNHSAQFWDTVRSVVPDYAARRKQLKSQSSAD